MGKKRVAVVVGGSVAGLACAHAVAGAGWDVVVLEKAAAPAPAAGGGGTGAGLGLDAQSMETLARWIPGWGLDAATLPLAVDLVRRRAFRIARAALGSGVRAFVTLLFAIGRRRTEQRTA
jgi:2-polyprenyl-6-methoxyphenol hydroxylase-like FAD-dependent oxidoreductase